MGLVHDLISEIEHEATNTGKMLERIPKDKFDWRPHEKSRTLKALATHIVSLSRWPVLVIKKDALDLAANPFPKPEVKQTEDLIRFLEEGTKASVAALKETTEAMLTEQPWILKNGEHIILDMPKAAVLRSMCMSHVYHHRAQLSVYLRLLDIPIPGMYGHSADEL